MGMEILGVGQAGMGEHPLPDAAAHGALPGAPSGGARARPVQSEGEVRQALDTLEQTFRLFNRRLQFSVNRELNRIVVKVIDRTTDKVIKEIPPEEIQHMAARMREMVGLLVDEKI